MLIGSIELEWGDEMTGALLASPDTVRERSSRRPPAVAAIGVLGGTFDPPHVGHLWLATLAADALGLDRVLFMPAAQPPHKGGRLVTKARTAS